MKSKILLIEDNILLSETIKELLELNGYNVVKSLSSGENIESHLNRFNPELILMDIRIEGDLDGVQLAKKIKNNLNIPIIFVTSFSDAEIIERVKEVKPEGFIIKPFSQETLSTTIELVLSKYYTEKQPSNSISHSKNGDDTFFVRDRGWLKKIKIKDIQYIKTEGTYTHIITDTQNFTLRSPIKDIAPNLPENDFKRVHKSYIVNLNRIDALCAKELKIKEEVIPIGRNYHSELQKMIQKLNE
ncbi:response regulator receiver [Indibacter alkaliphilus LW1]|jgi:two-component system response regulator LytT|uniref:Response regulator receiver n=1 Tax=Indibacter alkaliphilus (strain CCUG 57479 / KCTC 22604 / LW1) TaxID=1189612 RepID=S2DE17_INDAL|nr:response regulator [Indibacter alkaliphilus]EOZ97149.1 response regulator receiver [Indibacter alkaliphilus LW1]